MRALLFTIIYLQINVFVIKFSSPKKEKIESSFFDNKNLELLSKKNMKLDCMSSSYSFASSPVNKEYFGIEYPDPGSLFGAEKKESSDEFIKSCVKEEEDDGLEFLPFL